MPCGYILGEEPLATVECSYIQCWGHSPQEATVLCSSIPLAHYGVKQSPAKGVLA